MRQCLLCSSNMSVTHSALDFTRANGTDVSSIKLCAIVSYRLFHSHEQVVSFTYLMMWTGVTELHSDSEPLKQRGCQCDISIPTRWRLSVLLQRLQHWHIAEELHALVRCDLSVIEWVVCCYYVQHIHAVRKRLTTCIILFKVRSVAGFWDLLLPNSLNMQCLLYPVKCY